MNITKDELDALLDAMILQADGISDLLFITGMPMQVEVQGELQPFKSSTFPAVLSSDFIEHLAKIIIDGNPSAGGFEGTRFMRLWLHAEKCLPVSRKYLHSEW